MAEWISVKERLPEDRRSVLVYCPYNKCIYTAYYEDFNDEWYYFGCGGRIEVYYTVSHWMPLPEPPEEGGVKVEKNICFECKHASEYPECPATNDDIDFARNGDTIVSCKAYEETEGGGEK